MSGGNTSTGGTGAFGTASYSGGTAPGAPSGVYGGVGGIYDPGIWGGPPASYTNPQPVLAKGNAPGGWMTPAQVAAYTGPTNVGAGSRGVGSFGIPAGNYGMGTGSAGGIAASQTNPYSQAFSGSVGGKMSGPANPWNNGQFIQAAKPQTVFDSLRSAWDSLFSGAKLGSMAGIGVQPGAKQNTMAQAQPSATNPALVSGDRTTPTQTTGPFVSPFAGMPQPMTGARAGLPAPTGPADVPTALMRDAANKVALTLQANPNANLSEVDLGIANVPDVAIKEAAMRTDGMELIAIDLAAHSQNKVMYTDPATGAIIAPAPTIDNIKFQTVDDVSKAYFWNKYQVPYATKGLGYQFTSPARDARGNVASHRLALRGLPQQVDFAPERTINFSYGDLLNGEKDATGKYHTYFTTNLLNDGYSPKWASYFENIAGQIMWSNTPENITSDEKLANNLGPTRGQPYLSINIPGVLQTMTWEQGNAYIQNLENMTSESGRNFTLQGSRFVAGQTDTEIEKMSKGNIQIIPEYDQNGDYTGGLATMTREHGVIQPEGSKFDNAQRSVSDRESTPVSPASVYSNLITTSGWNDTIRQFFVQSSIQNKIIDLWQSQAPGTDFAAWLSSFDWQAFYNQNYIPTYGKKKYGQRYRSVSY